MLSYFILLKEGSSNGPAHQPTTRTPAVTTGATNTTTPSQPSSQGMHIFQLGDDFIDKLSYIGIFLYATQ